MILEVKGRYFFLRSKHTEEDHETQAYKDMADMLRYDRGNLLNIEVDPENLTYTAIVETVTYTPDRWGSFGIRTRPYRGLER